MSKNIFKIPIKNIAIFSIIAIFFIFDRYFKYIALNSTLNNGIQLIGDFFSFKFTANYYIAFSIPLSGLILNIIIISIILILICLIIYLIFVKYKQKGVIISLTIILFGAISNILDRLVYGFVIDYLELKYFTVFNLADAMISLGAISLFLYNLNQKKYV